jgi:hypothetical protein
VLPLKPGEYPLLKEKRLNLSVRRASAINAHRMTLALFSTPPICQLRENFS